MLSFQALWRNAPTTKPTNMWGYGSTLRNLGPVLPFGGGREAKLSLPLGGDASTSCARNGLCIAAALEVDLFPYKLQSSCLKVTTNFKCIPCSVNNAKFPYIALKRH